MSINQNIAYSCLSREANPGCSWVLPDHEILTCSHVRFFMKSGNVYSVSNRELFSFQTDDTFVVMSAIDFAQSFNRKGENYILFKNTKERVMDAEIISVEAAIEMARSRN